MMILAMAVAMLASGQAAAPRVGPAVGIVAQPCLPPLPRPELLVEAQRRILASGTMPIPAQALASNPQVQAYLTELKKRAAIDWANLCKYRAANQTFLARAKTPPRIVFMGDSITENWAVADPGFFSDTVLDRGISGQTSQQMLLRFEADVIALRPRAVHIMAGTNDIAGNGGPTTEQDIRNAIMAMVTVARAHHIRVLIASVPPAATFSWRPDIQPALRIIAFNHWLRNYAKRQGLTYIDYHSVLRENAGGLRQELSADGVHPNRDGYKLMEPLIRRALVNSP